MMKTPKKPQNPSPRTPQKPGFSLIEVLTVIAIISVLLTAGAIGIGNISSGKNTASALATCESLFDEARIIAVSKRSNARFMVKTGDPNEPDYLQKVVVVHEEIDSEGNPIEGNWILSSRGYTMPSGVYFSQEMSKGPNGEDLETFTLSGNKADFNGEYLFYEFNPEGIASNPGASFVLGAGTRARGQEPRTTSGQRDFAGFVIWRNGRISSYRNPGQIPGVDTLSGNPEF